MRPASSSTIYKCDQKLSIYNGKGSKLSYKQNWQKAKKLYCPNEKTKRQPLYNPITNKSYQSNKYSNVNLMLKKYMTDIDKMKKSDNGFRNYNNKEQIISSKDYTEKLVVMGEFIGDLIPLYKSEEYELTKVLHGIPDLEEKGLLGKKNEKDYLMRMKNEDPLKSESSAFKSNDIYNENTDNKNYDDVNANKDNIVNPKDEYVNYNVNSKDIIKENDKENDNLNRKDDNINENDEYEGYSFDKGGNEEYNEFNESKNNEDYNNKKDESNNFEKKDSNKESWDININDDYNINDNNKNSNLGQKQNESRQNENENNNNSKLHEWNKIEDLEDENNDKSDEWNKIEDNEKDDIKNNDDNGDNDVEVLKVEDDNLLANIEEKEKEDENSNLVLLNNFLKSDEEGNSFANNQLKRSHTKISKKYNSYYTIPPKKQELNESSNNHLNQNNHVDSQNDKENYNQMEKKILSMTTPEKSRAILITDEKKRLPVNNYSNEKLENENKSDEDFIVQQNSLFSKKSNSHSSKNDSSSSSS